MPELPEIETIRRGLQKKVVGKKISTIIVNWSKSFIGDPKLLKDKKIITVLRSGKLLETQTSDDFSLLIHLKMTGQLVFQSGNEKDKIVGGHPQKIYNQPLPHKHTHVIFNFKDGSKLFFNDLRKFGYIKLIKQKDVKDDSFVKTLAMDALADSFNQKYLNQILKRRPNSTIFQTLLDQKVVAGIGNIYDNEALYYCGILPTRKNKTISKSEQIKLIQKIKEVLKKSITLGGSSDNTYRQINGKRGNYLNYAAVYHQKLDPKNHTIMRQKISGRTVHFCLICQK